jgi:dienelactone hydrolase
MIEKNNIIVKNRFGLDIDVDLFRAKEKRISRKKPLVIFSHGFKGFKDWGGFPYLMEKIADAGFCSVSFNFTFNGVDKINPSEFTRLDLFAQNTFSKELDDLQAVIDYFNKNADEHGIDKDRIALIGHSRGGGISILKASEDMRIKCLVTLSSVSTFDRYTDAHKKSWSKKGYFEVVNTRTNQLMRINSTLLDDLESNKSKLDIISAVRKLNIPYLIIHGKEDISVRFDEAEELYKNSNKNLTELYEVKNTGHTFGTAHPFKGTTKAFESVIEKIIEFFSRKL